MVKLEAISKWKKKHHTNDKNQGNSMPEKGMVKDSSQGKWVLHKRAAFPVIGW
jgi:hypothetical protein